MLRAIVLEDAAACAAVADEWDALAVELGVPYASPHWMLAWWRHLRPPGAELRVVVISDDDGDVVGIVPLHLIRRHGIREMRFLGSGHRVGPLVRPGHEAAAADAAARVLGEGPAGPDVLRLDRADRGSPWADLLRSAWPSDSPRLRHQQTEAAPVVMLEGASFDEWLAGRSAKFRGQIRATQRKLRQGGGGPRLATPDTLEDDVAAFVELHHTRWRGGDSGLQGGMGALLRDAAAELLDRGRLRIWSIDLDGAPIAVAVNVVAGYETAFWGIGWDSAHSRLSPGLLAVAATVEDVCEREGRRYDLGGGAQPYKWRFTDVDAPVTWDVLIPSGSRSRHARAVVAAEQAERRARSLAKRVIEVAERRRGRWVRSLTRSSTA